MIHLDSKAILNHPHCVDQTARELMAYRWIWMEAQGDRPEALCAPRFSQVPWLRLPHPEPGQALRVHLTFWLAPDWHGHARVRHSGSDRIITLANTTVRSRVWRTFALDLPADAAWFEIGKSPEMECWLVSVDFEPIAAPVSESNTQAARRPLRGISIIDGICFLGATILPAYDGAITADFYHQMRGAGYTDVYLQVYHGSAGWSEQARRAKAMRFGHVSYANHREPAYRAFDTVQGVQQQIDLIRAAGLRVGASFRINNEWLVNWAMKWYRVSDGIPEVASAASVEHPEWWMTYKNGQRYGSGLDFGFPEVAAYRQAIVEEWCQRFRDFDVVCIDLMRHPPMVSYPEHLVRAFAQSTGIDVRTVEPVDQDTMLESWLRFRAGPFTQWMRAIRTLLQQHYGSRVKLSARVPNAIDRALQDGAELDVWLGEKIVDELLLESGTERHPLEDDVSTLARNAHAAGLQVASVFGKAASLAATPEGESRMHEQIERWREQGVDGVAFYEGERLASMGNWMQKLPAALAR